MPPRMDDVMATRHQMQYIPQQDGKLAGAKFVLESLAHLQGMERDVLPLAEHLGKTIDFLRQHCSGPMGEVLIERSKLQELLR